MNEADPKFFLVRALEFTLKNEGGFSDNPFDKGGPTNYGITQKTLLKFRGKPVSKDDVKTLEKIEAMEIYAQHYWRPLGCDKLDQFAVAAAMFDIGVLSGVLTSAHQAQTALSTCGFPDIIADGFIGPKSIAALNLISPSIFVKAFHLLTMLRVNEIAQHDPDNKIFLAGWENRVNRLLTLT